MEWYFFCIFLYFFWVSALWLLGFLASELSGLSAFWLPGQVQWEATVMLPSWCENADVRLLEESVTHFAPVPRPKTCNMMAHVSASDAAVTHFEPATRPNIARQGTCQSIGPNCHTSPACFMSKHNIVTRHMSTRCTRLSRMPHVQEQCKRHMSMHRRELSLSRIFCLFLIRIQTHCKNSLIPHT